MQDPPESQFIAGNDNLAVQFRDRVFFFETEDKLRRFMSMPLKYAKQKLPAKIPPKITRIAPGKLADK